MIYKFGKIEDLEHVEDLIINLKLENITTRMLILQKNFQVKETEIEVS